MYHLTPGSDHTSPHIWPALLSRDFTKTRRKSTKNCVACNTNADFIWAQIHGTVKIENCGPTYKMWRQKSSGFQGGCLVTSTASENVTQVLVQNLGCVSHVLAKKTPIYRVALLSYARAKLKWRKMVRWRQSVRLPYCTHSCNAFTWRDPWFGEVWTADLYFFWKLNELPTDYSTDDSIGTCCEQKQMPEWRGTRANGIGRASIPALVLSVLMTRFTSRYVTHYKLP